MINHPGVDKISFTGSVEVGKLIPREDLGTLKRITLELGGESPNIVFADADFEPTIQGTCFGVFWNQGEVCLAGSRVFVEKGIYSKALDAIVECAQAVKVGSGLDSASTMGPLVSGEQQAQVLAYID